MDYNEAISVIKNNYPPEQYTMLREALDLAIKLLQNEAEKFKHYSDGTDYKRS